MGYIGPIPAQVPLTSSDIEDGIITADKLATDSVETVKVKDVNITAGKLAATQDLSSKTITLPATVAGLGTGINVTNQITGIVPAANLGTGTASSTTILYGDGTYKTEPTTDLQSLKSDVTALALREATNEASAAFNLPNQFIDTFTDDTNLGTQTDGDRVSGYWSTIVAGTPAHQGITGMTSAGGNIVLTSPEANAITAAENGGTGGTTDTTATGNVAYTTGSSVSGYVIADLGASYSIEKMDIGKMRQNGDPRSILMKYHATATDPQASGTAIDFTGASATVKTYHTENPLLSNFSSSGTADWAAFASNNSGVINTITGFTPFTARYISYKFGSADFHDANASWTEMKFYKGTETASATGTLIQSANTVGSAKTKVGGTILYKDNAGTATLGTDLKIYFSCDNGSNWTEASSYNAITPVYSTGIKQVRLGETTCTSGTGVIYKAVWANQASGSKETQLHGIGINY